MPFNDLIQNHFVAADITAVNNALTAIETANLATIELELMDHQEMHQSDDI